MTYLAEIEKYYAQNGCLHWSHRSHLERIIKESGGTMPDRARDIIAEAKRGINAKG